MCCCGKPTVNGEPGYSWDGKSFGVRQPDPPALAEGDELIHDEPGRCGGLDSHCHHFRVVNNRGLMTLLVRHGGGDERIKLGSRPGAKALAVMDSTARYWVLQMLYHVQQHAARDARMDEQMKWARAAIEKRIRVRKQRGVSLPHGNVKVWIEG